MIVNPVPNMYVWKLFQSTESLVPVPRRYSYHVPGNHTPHCQRSSKSHGLENKRNLSIFSFLYCLHFIFAISFFWYGFFMKFVFHLTPYFKTL